MLHEQENPPVPPSDWQAFREAHPPFLIEEVIDRSEARLPDWFVPSAPGVAIASDYLLRQAGAKSRALPTIVRPMIRLAPLSDG
jgi:hypothetical protein